MNNIQINNQSLAVKEYQGQRVVTFKEIDRVHDRPDNNAKKRFFDNKKRFIENEDYFLVKPTDFQKSEIRTLGFNVPNRGLTLLTESGYLMIVKSFTDNLAWQVQRELVKNYFRVKEMQKVPVASNEEPCKLIFKTYKGKSVITLKDLERVSGVADFNVLYHINTKCLKGIDYKLLESKELKNFKSENNIKSPFITSLIVIYESAINKLIELKVIASSERLKEYFKSDVQQDTLREDADISFMEQIQACKIVSEDLNPTVEAKLNMYKYIYKANGLDTAFLDEIRRIV